MPKRLEKIFQKEYGKKKGLTVFYKWYAKRKAKRK